MSRDSPQDLPPELRDDLGPAPSEDAVREEPSDVEALWSLLEGAKPPPSSLPNASDTWAGVRRHIESESQSSDEPARSSEPRAQRSPRSRSSRRVGWRWGAVVAALLIAILGAWWWQQPVVVTAAPGTSVTHTLPDGSTAELNGGTRLTYPHTMTSPLPLLKDQRRTVRVRGEVYFKVRPGERPFVVRTQTARIEVLGTAFAVRTEEGSDQTHVALAEGTVRVQGRTTPDQAVVLQPGEAVQIGNEGPVSPPADTSIRRITAWRRGGFAVTAQPLPAIVRALKRQFGTPIKLSSEISEEVTSSLLTLYYPQDVAVETILHDVSMAQGLSYRPTTNGYVLLPADSARPPSGPSG